MTLHYNLSKPIEPNKILRDIKKMIQDKMHTEGVKNAKDMILSIDVREIVHDVEVAKKRLTDDRKNNLSE